MLVLDMLMIVVWLFFLDEGLESCYGVIIGRGDIVGSWGSCGGGGGGAAIVAVGGGGDYGDVVIRGGIIVANEDISACRGFGCSADDDGALDDGSCVDGCDGSGGIRLGSNVSGWGGVTATVVVIVFCYCKSRENSEKW